MILTWNCVEYHVWRYYPIHLHGRSSFQSWNELNPEKEMEIQKQEDQYPSHESKQRTLSEFMS
jgi:hypothetical protein